VKNRSPRLLPLLGLTVKASDRRARGSHPGLFSNNLQRGYEANRYEEALQAYFAALKRPANDERRLCRNAASCSH
jgi:hypothetical protein